MKHLKTVTVIASLFLLSNLLNAQPCENGYQGKRGLNSTDDTRMERQEKLQEKLGLTDEQVQKIESLKIEHQKKVLPLQNDLNEKEAKLRTLETSENVDLKAIYSLIDEIGVVKVKLAKESASNHQEIRKMLTPEQRVQFDTLGNRHREKGGKHRNN